MSKNKEPELVIQQLLHGYRDGHSLIVSSINLSAEAKRIVGVLSDMSGPSMQKGFEEYITGYPLIEFAMYAISKTWYAAEMPRPGSVWTHTLLISFSDLPKIKNADVLLNCFRRPDAKSKKFGADYGDSIIINSISDCEGITNSMEIPLTKCQIIISELYENSNTSLIIKSENSKRYESLILALWLQQWPRLRRQFSFCTGAIYPRSIEDDYFDIQVSPQRIESSFDLNSNFTIIEPDMNFQSISLLEWSEIAAKDLREPSPLRDYLREYGADSGSTRSSFINLVRSFIYFTSDDDKKVESLITRLSMLFPNEGDAETLKIDLLLHKNESYLRTAPPDLKEGEILLELAITRHYKAFNYDKLHFSDRFLFLCQSDSSHSIYFLNELLKHDVNPYGEIVLKDLTENLNEDQFRTSVDYLDRKLSFALAAQNSKLLYSQFFWQTYKNDHRELFSILLRNNSINDINWISIIDVLIKTNSDVAFQLLDDHELDITIYILDWSNFYNTINIGYPWQNLLRTRPTSVLNWLKSADHVNQNTLKLITSVLNPNSMDVIEFGCRLWIHVIKQIEKDEKQEALIAASAFGLALAFNKPDTYYLELLSCSFETTYLTLKSNTLNYIYWWPIEIHTRERHWYNDWDKCKKLIDALFINFDDIKWTKYEIDRLFVNEEIRKRVWERYNGW